MSLLDAAMQPETCTVYSPVYSTADAGGGTNISSWTTVASGEPCQVDPGGGSLRDQFGGELLADAVTLFLTRDTGLKNGWRVGWNGFLWRFEGGQGYISAMGSLPAQYQYRLTRVEA